MRDSVSFWVFDDRGEMGLPRVGIEALASQWEAHAIQVNMAFPDGRVYRIARGRAESARDGTGRASRRCWAPVRSPSSACANSTRGE